MAFGTASSAVDGAASVGSKRRATWGKAMGEVTGKVGSMGLVGGKIYRKPCFFPIFIEETVVFPHITRGRSMVSS